MHFVEMDPELALAAIKGLRDELSPEKAANDAFYRQFRCPRCGSSCNPEYHENHAFRGSGVVPRAMLRCLSCRGLMDPHTGLQIELGNLAEGGDPLPILRPDR